MDLDVLRDGSFEVWQPDAVEIHKSESDSEAAPRIAGQASTARLDRQGEEAMQRGLDFNEFQQHGWFNDNHQQHTSAAIGIPDREGGAKLTSKGWFVQGSLLKTPRAFEVFTLAKALKDTHRRLGFSIEGKILERSGNRIVKALIRNVAITNCPVNTDCTWDIVAKSWATDLDYKALDVGYQYPPSTGAGVLVPESLEGGEIRVVYECPVCKKAFGNERSLDTHLTKHQMSASPVNPKKTYKSYTMAMALDHIERRHPEWTPAECLAVVEHCWRVRKTENSIE